MLMVHAHIYAIPIAFAIDITSIELEPFVFDFRRLNLSTVIKQLDIIFFFPAF